MGSLAVVWNKKALKAFKAQALWYRENTSYQYIKTFSYNICKTVAAISAMPSIGRIEKVVGNRTYRSIPSHPKSRIYYWYNENEIRIVDIIFSAESR